MQFYYGRHRGNISRMLWARDWHPFPPHILEQTAEDSESLLSSALLVFVFTQPGSPAHDGASLALLRSILTFTLLGVWVTLHQDQPSQTPTLFFRIITSR